MDWDLPAARLVTTGQPVFNVDRRCESSGTGDLVDMPGWLSCASPPHNMIKGTTDTAGPADRKTLLKNLHRASETVGELLWEHVKRL